MNRGFENINGNYKLLKSVSVMWNTVLNGTNPELEKVELMFLRFISYKTVMTMK